jgi:hypothetical protein
MRDLPISDLDDRAKSIVIFRAIHKDGSVDFVLDDDAITIVYSMDNQLIGRLKFDVVAIALELRHQIGAPPDNARPTGDVVENLIDDVVGDDVEEVLAINEVAQRPSNQIEVRGGGIVGGVSRIGHPELSMRFARLLTKREPHIDRKLISKKRAL